MGIGRSLSVIDRAWQNGSVAKLCERRALVEGNMVGLGALDLILRNVRARMMGIALDLEIARMHANDRAADAPGLGIPTHTIADLEGFVMTARFDAWQWELLSCAKNGL